MNFTRSTPRAVRLIALLSFLAIPARGAAPAEGAPASPAATRTIHLSGEHRDAPVGWDFRLEPPGARGGGAWTRIPVPSNYELEGFGRYCYGHDDDASGAEFAIYRTSFALGKDLASGSTVYLTFDGSMTDTEATVNGRLAGPVHQGGFTSFRYNISTFVGTGQNNLEVKVWKKSRNPGINASERNGDFWMFGGIFRPVFLEILPPRNIARLLLDAQADASFRAEVRLGPHEGADQVSIQLHDADGEPFGPALTKRIDGSVVTVRGTFAGAGLWTPENPHLYTAKVTLHSREQPLHEVTERFGFRTFQILNSGGRTGAFINGKPTWIKGVNRHSFRPGKGRSLSPADSLEDILLIKGMNMNAVRCSHYPPDRHFLDLCDEHGLFVMDEVLAWGKPLPTGEGSKLVEETVLRDHNHPCVVMWANGNHRAFNPQLEAVFYKHDLQARRVLRMEPRTEKAPPMPSNRALIPIDTRFYPDWEMLTKRLNGPYPVMPCECLHGLYDAGSGSSLRSYWDAITASRYGVGMFLWSFADEGVVRSDLGGAIDVAGNKAPDGLVGPRLEREASYYTVRQVWSPIQVTREPDPATFRGVLALRNDSIETNLKQCSFAWEVLASTPTGLVTLSRGEQGGPDIPARGKGNLVLSPAPDLQRAHLFALVARGPDGESLASWSWALPWSWKDAAEKAPPGADKSAPSIMKGGPRITVSAAGNSFVFRADDLRLERVTRQGKVIPIRNGPDLVTKTGNVKDNGPGMRFTDPSNGSVTTRSRPDAITLSARKVRGLEELTWTVHANGSLGLRYRYELEGPHDFHGVTFDWADDPATLPSVTWFGNGPRRVWKNRLEGNLFGHWNKNNNDLVPGRDTSYPYFRGYHGPWHWLRLNFTAAPVTIHADGTAPFFRLGTPQNGESPMETAVPFPQGGFSLLNAIPGMGTKWWTRGDLGPSAQPSTAQGAYHGEFLFTFGNQ